MKMRIKWLAALSSSLKNGLLTHTLATIVAAGLISLLTLAASLYLFIFAGQGLLPPPPTADLPVTRMLEPIPVGAGGNVAETPGNTAIPSEATAETPAIATATAPLGLTVSIFAAAPSVPPAAPVPPAATVASAPAAPVVVASAPAAPTVSEAPGNGNNEEDKSGSDESGSGWSSNSGRGPGNNHASVASNSGHHSGEGAAHSHADSGHGNRSNREAD
ncbi:MAG: hypothetical protein M1455_03475 [Actinobacteria bacterium]|nr:hypothetical protein [Actinomycetota bacterium]